MAREQAGRDEPRGLATAGDAQIIPDAASTRPGRGHEPVWTDASRTTGAGTCSNCFLLGLDQDGRCRDYTEFSTRHPEQD